MAMPKRSFPKAVVVSLSAREARALHAMLMKAGSLEEVAAVHGTEASAAYLKVAEALARYGMARTEALAK